MKVLTLNCGSSSLKFEAIAVAADGTLERIAQGAVERLGEGATATITAGDERVRREQPVADHDHAFALALELLADAGPGDAFAAVGHRVVHGGVQFRRPVRVDDTVIEGIAAASALAPLHNRPALAVIAAARGHFGTALPMVATFDTAFTAHLPEAARTYALPRALAERFDLRRFGFHGLAHRSMVEAFRAQRPGVAAPRLVSLQLGNGCSATASRDGVALDTSMGVTPLEGLVMGTRSGDLDPAVPSLLAKHAGLTPDDVDALLNLESGLLGLSGLSHDMGTLIAAAADGHAGAALAIEVFCHRARKYVGAYLAVLGGADAVLFGGGIGERSPEIRERICDGFAWAGLRIDRDANRAADGQAARISTGDSAIEAWMMRPDEAAIIARDVVSALTGHADDEG